jgi:hypothetical protein
VNEIVQRYFESAEKRARSGDYKNALARLEDALWNVRVIDGAEDFDRIEALAVLAAEESEGRVSAKAHSLVALCEARRKEVMASGATPWTVAPRIDHRPAPDAHRHRGSLAWWLKVAGLSLIALLGILPAVAVAVDGPRDSGTLVGVLVAVAVLAALGLGAWHRPALVGALAVAFAPIGFFLVLLGSTNLDPTSHVLVGTAYLSGLPLAAGVLLLIAARLRADKEETRSRRTS